MGDIVSNLFRFDGRVGRKTFWIVWVSINVFVFVLYLFGETVGSVGFLVSIPVGIANSIKRWHDRGKSGWWVLIVLVPIIGAVWALIETGFLSGDETANRYGLPESEAT